MARFNAEIPDELVRAVNDLEGNAEEIFMQMTEAGAKATYKNVKSNVPTSFKSSGIMNCLKVTKNYKTIYDDACNTKVGFYGYFTNKDGKLTPAPLVANVFEYGSSKFQKKPFFKKSFNKKEIESVMRAKFKELTGGEMGE